MDVHHLYKEYDCSRAQFRVEIETSFDHTFEDQIKISNEVGTTLLNIIKQRYSVESCYSVTVNIYTPTIPSYRGGSYGFPFEPCVNIFPNISLRLLQTKARGTALLAAKLKDPRHFVMLL